MTKGSDVGCGFCSSDNYLPSFGSEEKGLTLQESQGIREIPLT